MKFILIGLLLLSNVIAETAIPQVSVGDVISAEKINEMIAFINKIKTEGRYPVKKHNSGKNWYIIYNDGWVEQAQYLYNPGTGPLHRFQIKMKDTDYTPSITSDGSNFGNVSTQGKTIEGLYLWTSDDASFNASYFYMIIKGFGDKTAVENLGASPNY